MKKTLSIVKIGGNVLDEPAALQAFLRDFAALGGAKILVHGGGKIASSIGQRLGLEARYVQGRRITDDATLELVTMVYGGLVNRQLTAQLQALGCMALGLSGADGNALSAGKRPAGAVDYGWAGDTGPERVNTTLLQQWLDQGLTPVFAPLTHDGQGQLLNTNADTIASVLAQALSAVFRVRLLFCFEKKGVLSDPTDDASALPSLRREQYRQLQDKTAVSAGILPKLDNAFAAAAAGVETVLIGSAADLLANAADATACGTRILA
ncbi:MAG: acetylglutamate kinase [Saprospiraceae bacterium]|nr:acetylglutamate kinase [Saprospiraceae bacterium]